MNFGCRVLPQIRTERNGEPHPEGPEIVRNKRQHVRTSFKMHCFGAAVARRKENLQERFARVTANYFVRRVAHTHDFFPIGHTRSREDWRANSDCDDAAAREPRAVAKRVARSCQRYRHDRTPRRDGCFKGAKLEWPQTRSRGESSLRKDENRFTVTQR